MSNELHLEYDFVQELIKTQKPVAVFLKNGIKLSGVIAGADEHCLYIKNIITQLVYKHAVSTVTP